MVMILTGRIKMLIKFTLNNFLKAQISFNIVVANIFALLTNPSI